MSDNGYEVFVSYRRSDVMGWAVTLYERLRDALGTGVVFMDTEGIGPGDQFPTELADALESAQIMLVIVGPSWAGELEERAQAGTNDWVVREIQSALERGVRLIPVLVDKAAMPQTAELPDPIKDLRKHQYYEVRGSAYSRDVDGLIEAVSAARAGLQPDDAAGPGGQRILDAGGWNSLLGRIKSGDCVPVLGPAVAPALEPSSETLLAQARSVPAALIGDHDLPRVAQAVSIGRDRAFVRDTLQKERERQVAGDDGHPGDLCRSLAELALPLFLTTSYGDELAQALVSSGRLAQTVEPARQSHLDGGIGLASQPIQIQLSVDSPTVLHLFGRFENPGAMTLTEDDFFDLLVRMSREQGFFDAGLRGHIATSSMLFVGFSLDDWRFRLLLRGLGAQFADTGVASIAVVQIDPDDLPVGQDQASVSAFVERYFALGRTVDVRAYVGTAAQFTQNLQHQLTGKSEQAQGS